MIRSQQYAREAYRLVATVEDLETYLPRVRSLGTAVLRSGLCAALDWTNQKRGGSVVIGHVAQGVMGQTTEGSQLVAAVRRLPSVEYMDMTRKVLSFVGWLKRAADAREISPRQNPEAHQ